MPSKQPAGGGKGQPQLSAQRESYADIFQRFGQLLKPWNGRCRIRGSRDDNTYLTIITQRECELLKCGARGMSDLEKPDTPAKLLNWIEYLLTFWETLREAHWGDYRPQGYLPVMIANSRVEAFEFAQNLRKARRTLRELP